MIIMQVEKEQLESLPVIDMTAYVGNGGDRQAVAQQIREICKEVGFFYVKNHGVSLQLQHSLLENAEKFFNFSLL